MTVLGRSAKPNKLSIQRKKQRSFFSRKVDAILEFEMHHHEMQGLADGLSNAIETNKENGRQVFLTDAQRNRGINKVTKAIMIHADGMAKQLKQKSPQKRQT